MAKKKTEVILPSDETEKIADKKTIETMKTTKTKKHINIKDKRRAKAEAEARRRAEDLAKLPKEPVKRFFARLHPKRVFRWWFSWRGQKAILKAIAACILIGIIMVGGLFLYYKKDLDEIRLDEMAISETVNTYLDRNGVVLWKDTGSDNYRLVVKKEDIAENMYYATIAIEDKNFENHIGVDFTALIRATFATLTGQGVQGGSTLTQQLIKQVYFSDEAASANRGGLTRKIKELILSIELERMYSKEEIITMYLNQSPYGGRRNGVESAARTYFGKSAKDLTLAECALLAAIPNNPAVLNPYNTYGNEMLIERQHKVLDMMAEQGYISEDEAKAAKEVAILDTIQSESSQYADALAPHFVLEVKSQLEKKYGISTLRAGGWTITTTLDYRAQQIAEAAVQTGSELLDTNGSDNIALASIDVDTSQVIAMVGSVDFSNVTYGELNVTTDSLIEPGSTIKPILDYTPLFVQREGVNYGPGTILVDENIDALYCNGNTSGCRLRNYTGAFYGDTTIRVALSNSLNIPAVKALYINGIENSLKVAHSLGDESYCNEGETNYGLSIAVGSGCRVRLIEHANAYASLARGGDYKDLAYVLEIKNSSGDVIEFWEDKKGKDVVNEQVAYMISSILSDAASRSRVFGSQSYAAGFIVPDVWTASKTGTTTTSDSSVAKDSLMISYSTALSTIVWNGNHDGAGLANSSNTLVRQVVNDYMERAHKEVYEPDGKWSYGDEPAQPTGMKTLTVNGRTDIWPSWFDADKNSGVTKETLIFNRYNYLLASTCTPENYKIEVEVSKITDPFTKEEYYSVPEPYNKDAKDTCDYIPPSISHLYTSGTKIVVDFKKGSQSIGGFSLFIDGEEQAGAYLDSNGVVGGYTLDGTESSVKVMIADTSGYTIVEEITLTPTKKKTNDKTE